MGDRRHHRGREIDFEVVLELTRGHDAPRSEASLRDETEYLLRSDDGAYTSARFPWSHVSPEDLLAVQQGEASPQALQRVGDALRTFLEPLGWIRLEAEILRALGKPEAPAAEALITIRCNAGELCRLPLESLTLEPSGQALGQKNGCHVQWEWPGTETAPRTLTAPPEGGALLLAWSAAGGVLDAAGQFRAIQAAAKVHGHPGKVEQLAHVSVEELLRVLDKVKARGETVAVLHLLCHGGPLSGDEGGYGLWLRGQDSRPQLVAPTTLAAALEPYAGLVGCVVLCACYGANLDSRLNVLGSVAQRLHRAGFPAVVASRAPLSGAGARAFCEAFYDALLAGEPLHRAVARGRRQLGAEWAAIQLYARAKDGPQYPVVFRPYRGLQAFEEKDRRFFFGRERLTGELLGRVVEASKGIRPRFQMVAGSSGSGKSSLVKAGLVPELRRAGWHITTLRPGGDGGQERGLSRLAQAFGDLRREAGAQVLETDAEENGANEAAVMLEARRLREESPDVPILVVVDQLEEAFKLEGSEVQSFLGCVWALAKDDSLRLVVVSTFRADLLEKAEDVAFEESVTLLGIAYQKAHLLYVSRMNSTELLDAIRRPLNLVGLSFEAGVAERLLEEAGKEPGTLPLLEHALDAVWQSRERSVLTRVAYEALGGLAGALTRQLDLLWEKLPPGQRRQGQRLLVALVDFADDATLSTRRRGWVEKLKPGGTEAAEAFSVVLEWLVARRLLVRGQPEEGVTSGNWVEIAHEALIRRWTRLQDWLRAGRADEVLLRELEAIASEWEKRRHNKERGDSYLPAGGKLESFEDLERRVGPLSPGPERCLGAARDRHRRGRRRTQAVLAGLAGVATTLFALALVAFTQWRNAVRQRDTALSRELTAYVQANIKTGDPQLNLALLKQARSFARTEQFASTLAQWVRHPGRALMRGHQERVTSAAFSPDGRFIVSASQDHTARLWESTTGRLVATLKHSDSVLRAAFSSDGKRVVTASEDMTACIWDVATGKLQATLSDHSNWVRAAAFSPNGQRVITASGTRAFIWDTARGERLNTLHGHTKEVRDAAFSPDGLRAITAGEDGKAFMWDVMTGKRLYVLRGHSEAIHTVAFDPDGRLILTVGDDKKAHIWDALSGELMATLSSHSEIVRTAAFSPDGLLVITANWDNTARVWEAKTGKLLSLLSGHTAALLSVAFSKDGSRIVSASEDHTARVWDTTTGLIITILAGHSDEVHMAAFNSDDSRVVTAGEDKTVRVWDTTPGKPVLILGHSDSVQVASFSPDSQRLLTTSWDRKTRIWNANTGKLLVAISDQSGIATMGALSRDGQRAITVIGSHQVTRVWDVATAKPLAMLSNGSDRVTAVGLSPNNIHVVIATGDEYDEHRTVRIWDVEKATPVADLFDQSYPVYGIAFSRDGRRVLMISDNKIRTCTTATGELLSSLRCNDETSSAALSPDGGQIATVAGSVVRIRSSTTGQVLSSFFDKDSSELSKMEFSPDGQRLIAPSGNKSARIWDVATGKLLVMLSGHSDTVRTATFSPDGLNVVTASDDRTAKVWNAQTGDLLTTLSGHTNAVYSAVFSPDCRRIITASLDSTARVWEDASWMPPSEQDAVLTAGRDLTPEERHIFLHENEGAR